MIFCALLYIKYKNQLYPLVNLLLRDEYLEQSCHLLFPVVVKT